jgi:hypothetical protein
LKWGQMAHLVGALILGLMVAMSVIPTSERAPQLAAAAEILGACYCRAAGQLTCTADLSRPECDKRCAQALCDDWFWLERRPCWNWGYGG